MPISQSALGGRLRLAGLRSIGLLLRSSSRPTPRADARMLVIRPDHLGDLLLSTPAIAELRAELPEAHLALMVGPWAADLVSHGPPVDEVLACSFPGFTRRPARWIGEPYVELMRQARRLRRGRYGLAVILRPDHWWGALLAAVAGIPERLGYGVPECQPFLTRSLPWPASGHVAEQSLKLVREVVRSLGATPPRSPRQAGGRGAGVFRLAEDERAWAAGRLQQLGMAEHRQLIVLHPGSGAALKLWPAGRWAELIQRLREQIGAQVLITGSLDEADFARAIAEQAVLPAALATDSMTIGQLGALLERADLVIGSDSGPMHLAAALGRPTVRLFGPTDPELFGPWPAGPEQRVVRVQLPCSPCGNLVDPPCGARVDPACMTGIEVTLVFDAALAVLREASARRETAGV